MEGRHTHWRHSSAAAEHTPHGKLSASPRRRLQEGNDARAPPPPNTQIWGFHPGIGEGERGVCLGIASKEEDGVQDVANAVTDTAGQGFLPAKAPSTANPPLRGEDGWWVPRDKPGCRTPAADERPPGRERPPPPRRPRDREGRASASARAPAARGTAAVHHPGPPPRRLNHLNSPPSGGRAAGTQQADPTAVPAHHPSPGQQPQRAPQRRRPHLDPHGRSGVEGAGHGHGPTAGQVRWQASARLSPRRTTGPASLQHREGARELDDDPHREPSQGRTRDERRGRRRVPPVPNAAAFLLTTTPVAEGR